MQYISKYFVIYNEYQVEKIFKIFLVFTNISFLVSLLVYRMGPSIADPDIWHQMALARESMKLGYVPYNDLFSYSETIYPSVHHEWGAGFILYFITTLFGYNGVAFLRYFLTAILVIIILFALYKKRVNIQIILFTMPIPIYLFAYGTSAVRAQMYSFIFIALLLFLFDFDRKNIRWWMLSWMFAYIFWLNIHGGFLFGLILVTIYGFEQFINKRPYKHILVLVIIMTALIIVNPFGVYYYPYLINAIIMKRPNINEWHSILSADLSQIVFFSVALVLILYVTYYWRLKSLNGLFLIFATAIFSVKSQRMLPFFAILWIYMVPGWIERTPLGQQIVNVYKHKAKFLISIFLIASGIFLFNTFPMHICKLQVLNEHHYKENKYRVYPVKAVRYLKDIKFKGKILVPFDWGAYIIWELYPEATVSLDSRYEATYPGKVVDDQYKLFMGANNWKILLQLYKPDIIITHKNLPLAKLIKNSNEWTTLYEDGNWKIFSDQNKYLTAEENDMYVNIVNHYRIKNCLF